MFRVYYQGPVLGGRVYKTLMAEFNTESEAKTYIDKQVKGGAIKKFYLIENI